MTYKWSTAWALCTVGVAVAFAVGYFPLTVASVAIAWSSWAAGLATARMLSELEWFQ